MLRKIYFVPILFIGLFIIGSITVSAQATIGGTVTMKKADSEEKVPVAGAKVDCYRLDIKQGCRSAETNKKGEFLFLGIPYSAKVVLVVSGEGLNPVYFPNVPAGTEDVEIEVLKGNGEVLTEEAVREALEKAVPVSGELTAEQKAELAKREAEIAKIEANNAKIEEKNKLRVQYLEEGNAAFNKKDWDLAITKFEDGYKIDPEYLGSAPVFLNNKAQALKQRTVDNYNEAVKSKDKNMINKARADSIKDFTEALVSANKSYLMNKNAKPAEIIDATKTKETVKLSEAIVKDIFRIMSIMNITLASNLTTEEDATTAVSLYQTSLKMLPDNPDVIAGLAMALYSSAEFKGNKEEKKASLDFWNQYKKVAPKDHSQQATADGMIEFLKTEVN
jgi:tetratricopeptide (TPR) repeat protein